MLEHSFFRDEIATPLVEAFRAEKSSFARGFSAVAAVDSLANHSCMRLGWQMNGAFPSSPSYERQIFEDLKYEAGELGKYLELLRQVSNAFRHGKRHNPKGISTSSGEIQLQDMGCWSAYFSRSNGGPQLIFESANIPDDEWLKRFGMPLRFRSLETILDEALEALEVCAVKFSWH